MSCVNSCLRLYLFYTDSFLKRKSKEFVKGIIQKKQLQNNFFLKKNYLVARLRLLPESKKFIDLFKTNDMFPVTSLPP